MPGPKARRDLHKLLTRRGLLSAGGMAVLVAGVVACSTKPDRAPESSPRPKGGKESSTLARKVARGELPPVAKRLPRNPLSVKPTARIGAYGGTWHSGILGPSDTAWLDRAFGYEYLLRWKPDTSAFRLDEVLPNVAESFSSNSRGTEYTFRLRADMKWSDGEQFTADDILFAINDVYLNKKLYPIPPLALLAGTGAGRVEKIDRHTVKFTFDQPTSLFPHLLASKNSGVKQLTALPRHYLSAYHADHNPNIDSVVKKEHQRDWIALFSAKSDLWNNPRLPRLHAWLPTNAVADGTRIAFEASPYYWKVDSRGQQLPYVQQLLCEYGNEEVLLLKALNGEIDMYDRLINSIQNKPVLARGRSNGKYHFFDLAPGNMNAAIISLNLTHKDDAKRQIFQQKDFRIGLSHAIDRSQIIETVYRSQGVAWQAAPLPASDYFSKPLAKQYTGYDVGLANKHLDRAGYIRRDTNGIRLGPDGAPISFSVSVSNINFGFAWTDVLELVKSSWRKVGITITISNEEHSLFQEREGANSHDASIWQGDSGGLDPHLSPYYYFPYSSQSSFALGWAQWYQSGGSTGEKPPEGPRSQMLLYDQFQATMDKGKQADLMTQLLQIAQDQFYAIGICRPVSRYGVATDAFGNVPHSYIESSNYPNPGPTNPEQYFVNAGI